MLTLYQARTSCVRHSAMFQFHTAVECALRVGEWGFGVCRDKKFTSRAHPWWRHPAPLHPGFSHGGPWLRKRWPCYERRAADARCRSLGVCVVASSLTSVSHRKRSTRVRVNGVHVELQRNSTHSVWRKEGRFSSRVHVDVASVVTSTFEMRRVTRSRSGVNDVTCEASNVRRERRHTWLIRRERRLSLPRWFEFCPRALYSER